MAGTRRLSPIARQLIDNLKPEGTDMTTTDQPITTETATDRPTICVRCVTTASTGPCCTAHRKELCHGCYRRMHFVEVCVAGCQECATEGLPVIWRGGRTAA